VPAQTPYTLHVHGDSAAARAFALWISAHCATLQ
jgi:hypothetical protein